VTIVIAVANQKGGVGKTTTCTNLAASLVVRGKNVLLIDSDPQGNATMGSGIEKNKVNYSLNDVLLGECRLQKALYYTDAGYDLIPGNEDLTIAEVKLLNLENRESQLKQAISGIQDQYDYCLIDCPPSLNMLTINGLVAASDIIIPMQCEYYALEGLAGLLNTVKQIQKTVNPTLKVLGVLRTMFDGRSRLTTDVSQQLQNYFGEQLYKTLIPRNIRLAEAPSYGVPGIMYDKQAVGAKAYLALADELLANETITAEQDFAISGD